MLSNKLKIYDIFLLIRTSVIFTLKNWKSYSLVAIISCIFNVMPHWLPTNNKHLLGGLDVIYNLHFLLLLFFLLCSFYLQGAIILKIWEIFEKKPQQDQLFIYKKALKKLPLALIVMFLSSISITLGIFFLIIPGLALLVYFIFSYPLSFIENTSPLEIIKKSYSLVSGNWWFIFTSLFLSVLLVISASSIIENFLLGKLVLTLPIGEIHFAQSLVRLICSFLLTIFILPYYLIIMRALMLGSAVKAYEEITGLHVIPNPSFNFTRGE